jgi:hypothetical protein
MPVCLESNADAASAGISIMSKMKLDRKPVMKSEAVSQNTLSEESIYVKLI